MTRAAVRGFDANEPMPLGGQFPRGWRMYRIREVDGHDDEVADTLRDLHRLTFFDGAPIPAFDRGHWWLALEERKL